ncbi:MAG TPA: hypothetical protein DIU07_01450 [Rhodobacteraceae bacterium]|nr:hypothetical protein [Paracoccaceae bacterium]
MSRRTRFLLLSTAAVVVVVVAIRFGTDLGTWFVRWWEIDACLDAGGGWDRETDACYGAQY